MSIQSIKTKFLNLVKSKEFNSSSEYWNSRYNSGGNSGKGSYGKFAEFKAEVINEFLKANEINNIIEFGCGDGNQLTYFEDIEYTGIDISQKVIDKNKEKFQSRNFLLLKNFISQPFSVDVTMSLDVIYHLVEDDVFDEHMRLLFDSAEKFVIIYSSNQQLKQTQPHVKHRKFDDWISSNANFSLHEHIKNPYPQKEGESNFSHADFFIYKRNG